MRLCMDYEHTDHFARMLTDFTDFLYNFLLEVVGFTLTLGFASCLQDSTDTSPVSLHNPLPRVVDTPMDSVLFFIQKKRLPRIIYDAAS